MSPYDDGWLLGSMHELGVEIAINDPRTEIVARRPPMTYFALVCTKCRLILKRDHKATTRPPSEPAPSHRTHQGPMLVVCGIEATPECDSKTAIWHQIAED